MKKKVLIIPSWYPTPSQFIGSFFQEQAEIMTSEFEIRVIYVQNQILSRRKNLIKYLINFFLPIKKLFKIDLPDLNLFNNPPLFFFKYQVFNSAKETEYLCKAYKEVLQGFIDNGWKPELIHAQSVLHAGIVANYLSSTYQVPYIITEHNFFSLPAFELKVRPLVKKSLEEASKILTVSHDKARQILSYDIDVNPITVWNLVNENKFNLQKPYKKGEKIQIISITASSFFKDNLTMLKVLHHLKEMNIDFHCTIIGLKSWGINTERELVYSFIEKKHLSESTTILDYVDRQILPNQFSNKHVFLLTSIAEGMPVSVLEAMASGLYVIATRHGGSEDIITSKEIGQIINLKDHSEGANIIKQIVKGDLTYTPQLIRDHVISFCGNNAFRKRLNLLYNKAIEKK